MTDTVGNGRPMTAAESQARQSDTTVVDTRPTETRRSFKTSEFWVFIMIAAAVIIATYTDDNDSLTEWRGWLLFCAAGIAYIVSRGLAKAGSSEPRVERVDLS